MILRFCVKCHFRMSIHRYFLVFVFKSLLVLANTDLGLFLFYSRDASRAFVSGNFSGK